VKWQKKAERKILAKYVSSKKQCIQHNKRNKNFKICKRFGGTLSKKYTNEQ
jgi:hypothetical protein